MRIPSAIVFVILIICYLIIPVIILFFVRDSKKFKITMWIFMSLFLILLLIGVLGDIYINSKIVYIGCDFSGEWFNKVINFKFNTNKIDRIINIFMLMPLGSYVFMLSKRKGSKWGVLCALALGLLSGVVIESLQFILPVKRSVQLADVFYNTLSCVLGYLYLAVIYYFVRLVKYIFSETKNTYK